MSYKICEKKFVQNVWAEKQMHAPKNPHPPTPPPQGKTLRQIFL